jgi:N-acetyl-beta-hexosaminidase
MEKSKNNHKIKKTMFLVLAFVVGVPVGKAAVQEYSVLPAPQQIEYASGSFKIKDKLTIAFPRELAKEAALMSQFFAGDFSIHPVLLEGKKKANVVLTLDASVLPDQPEGYILDVQRKRISISANTPAGILHGIQTLRQIVRNEHEALLVQAGAITDYPALGWRDFMLDESRHFQGKRIVFKILDNMSRLKMNVFHWHLTDGVGWRIEIKKYPELTRVGSVIDFTLMNERQKDPNFSDGKPHGGFYTQEEIKEIVAYASERNITIVPEIDMPSHSDAAIQSYPWLGTGGIYNIIDPKVVAFLQDVLEEVIALFPGKVIHIGGDEVDYNAVWKKSPAVMQYMKDNNILSCADLQLEFTNKMAQFLTSKNRRLMGWIEITGKLIPDFWMPMRPEDHVLNRQLDPTALVHCWWGDTIFFKKIIQEGYDIVNSSFQFAYLDRSGDQYISLKKAYSFDPIPGGLTDEQKKKVIGLGCRMWTEWVTDEQNLNSKVYPRIAAIAECGWTSPEKKDYSRFLNALDYFLATWKRMGIEYGSFDKVDKVATIDLDYLNKMMVNVDNAKTIWDHIHTLATLQGIVNRENPRLYLFYVENEGVNIDRYWWDKYRQSGKWLAEADVTEYQDIVELVTAFKKDIQGAVVYDPRVPSTSNLASTIAGVENLIAIRYDSNPNSLYSKLIVGGPKIPVKRWLIGQDGKSLFTGKTDAYTWLIENYLTKKKCNTEFAGYYVDCYWLQSPNNNPSHGIQVNQHTLTNHDFFVSKKGFFFDLSPWEDEPATDDLRQPAGKDLEMLKTMLLLAYRQNDNGRKFTHIGGVQPWGFKYSNFNGIGGKHNPEATEWEYAKIISAYNAVEDADGYNHGALANASFWQHFPVKREYPQKWITQQELIEKGYLDRNGKLALGKKKLLIYYAGDYDGASWMSQHTPTVWDDPKRGQVPIMWGFGPLLVERVPMALDYRRETATPNDYFVAANNGAGYMNPGMLQAPRPVSGLPDGNSAWAKFNAPYYKQWGLTVTGFLLDGASPAMSDKGFEAYSAFSPNGIVAQNRPSKDFYGEMPVFKWEWDDEDRADPKSAARYAVAKVNRTSIPFCWIRNVIKSPSFYVDMVNEMKILDPDIELVTAPAFFELYRIYLKENNKRQ